MDFRIYTQREVLADRELTVALLDILVDNLSYLFGDDMGSPENRSLWIKNNLEISDASWRLIVGSKGNTVCGFLITATKGRTLCVRDIEIQKAYRLHPALLRGLFGAMFAACDNDFDEITGYIHKRNAVSQKHFLRLATAVTATENGYALHLDKAATAAVRNRYAGK